MIKTSFNIYKNYAKELLFFSLPIIMGNLGHVLIGAGDVFVAARHGSSTVQAISIATSISMSIYIVGIGLMASISPVLANYRGERKRTKKFFMASVNYSLILALIFCIITLLSVLFIDKMGFEAGLVPLIKEYIIICAFSVFGAYLHFGLKEFLQSYEIVFLPNIISIAAIFVNILLNVLLVFGIWIFPELGIKGLAIASLIVRSFMGLTLFLYCLKFIKGSVKMDKPYLNQLIKIGYPISLGLLFEFLGFNIITIIVGRISGVYAAAHTIVLTLASITFMIPLAISNAVAVKAGYANGAGNYLDLKRFSVVGTAISLVFMGSAGVLFFLIPEFFIKIFTSDIKLLEVCIPLLYVAALFQVFDGLQVVLGGILKGLKMTSIVFFAMFAGYWIIGIPLGSILAFKFNLNLLGYWIGLAFALFSISFVMFIILFRKFTVLKKTFLG
ncbi:MAG TPA: MATE family efflux transporter [Candidatus Gastranaerophilales bacterium]|nr:MATE family efflux transporter [Candidatus Gastranaerophilales bacterium]